MKIFLIAAIILLIIGGGIFFLITNQNENINKNQDNLIPNNLSADKENKISQNSQEQENELAPCPSETATGCRKIPKNEQRPVNGCTGKGAVTLSSPMKYEDIGIIIPMGVMVGGHVTPIDHMYFQPIIFNSPPDSYDVYADADGVISSIGREANSPENKYNKYRIIIYHSCDFYSIYNLITSLSPEITAKVGEIAHGSNWGGSIPIKKGDLLGRIGGQTLDLSINYNNFTLSGFINPESYAGEDWKIHTVDPFDFWDKETKEKLMEKNIRKVPPYGGKIDYDVEGRLVGNWFVENTNGYRGVNPKAYWDTHLAFVYNEIDPSFIIISLGNFGGEAKQFAVKGNSPNPTDVSLSTGLVKYELVEFYYTSNREMWDHMNLAPNIGVSSNEQVKGTVLAQLIETNKVKVESFPDKKASEVNGFTSSAKIYTR